MNEDDKIIVEALIARDPQMTKDIFFMQCYPLFKAVYEKYDTDCEDCIEFINEIYVYILTPHEPTGKSYLENFTFKCRFVHWLKIIAENYCKQLFRKKSAAQEIFLEDSDRQVPDNDSLDINLSSLNAMDISRLLSLMPTERYRQIIRMVYLEDRSFEEVAAILKMSIDNFYNKHRLAKLQYLAVLQKEREQAIQRSRKPSKYD